MRTLFLTTLIAAVALPAAAFAQTRAQPQQDLRLAQLHGSRHDARDPRRDVRHNQREEWRDYRQHNRNVFRGPRYVGPRGYRYRVLAPGYRLAPAYYGSRYIIADPYRYRLPRPNGVERWIRYGNDVLLVNTRTGRVVTVYRDFFF